MVLFFLHEAFEHRQLHSNVPELFTECLLKHHKKKVQTLNSQG